MEDKNKKREANFKKFWEGARRYAVNFTKPVESHEEMLAKVP